MGELLAKAGGKRKGELAAWKGQRDEPANTHIYTHARAKEEITQHGLGVYLGDPV